MGGVRGCVFVERAWEGGVGGGVARGGDARARRGERRGERRGARGVGRRERVMLRALALENIELADGTLASPNPVATYLESRASETAAPSPPSSSPPPPPPPPPMKRRRPRCAARTDVRWESPQSDGSKEFGMDVYVVLVSGDSITDGWRITFAFASDDVVLFPNSASAPTRSDLRSRVRRSRVSITRSRVRRDARKIRDETRRFQRAHKVERIGSATHVSRNQRRRRHHGINLKTNIIKYRAASSFKFDATP